MEIPGAHIPLGLVDAGCGWRVAVRCQLLRLATGSFKATRAYQYPRLSSDISARSISLSSLVK